jgi:hypothetical protein
VPKTGRRPAHNESVFEFVKELPLYIMKKTPACSMHIFLPFRCSFIADQQLVFMPDTAVVLGSNS